MSYARMLTIVLCSGMLGAQLGMGNAELLPAYGLILSWELLGSWRECWRAEA